MSDRYYYHYHHNRHHQETRGGTSVFVPPCTVFPAGSGPGQRHAAAGLCLAAVLPLTQLVLSLMLYSLICSFQEPFRGGDLLVNIPGGGLARSSPSTGGTKFAEVLDSILPPSPWASCGCRKVEFRKV